jgi:hypothetical protein
LLTLTANSYAGQTLGRDARSREFAFLSALARRVPLRQVHRPDSMAALERLCDAILDDFENAVAERRETERP